MEAFICNSYIFDFNDHFKDYNIILFSRFILSSWINKGFFSFNIYFLFYQ